MGVVDFSRYVPFEAADDFGFGEPLAGAALDVAAVAGWLLILTRAMVGRACWLPGSRPDSQQPPGRVTYRRHDRVGMRIDPAYQP
jgi:hypothetical protein